MSMLVKLYCEGLHCMEHVHADYLRGCMFDTNATWTWVLKPFLFVLGNVLHAVCLGPLLCMACLKGHQTVNIYPFQNIV